MEISVYCLVPDDDEHLLSMVDFIRSRYMPFDVTNHFQRSPTVHFDAADHFPYLQPRRCARG